MNKDLKMKRKSGDGRLKKWLYKIRPIRVTGDKTEDPQVAHRWRRFVDKAQTIALQDPSQRYENVLDIVGEEVYNRVSPMLGLPELEDIYPERFFKAALRPKTIVAPTHPLHRRPVAVEKSLRSLASTYPGQSNYEAEKSEWGSVGSTSVSRTTRAFSSATLKTGEGMERSMRSVFEIDTEFSNYTTVSQVTYTDSQPRIIRDSGAEYPQVEGGPEDEEEEGWDMLVNPPTPPPQRKREDVLKDMRSPYQKFFLLSEEEATKWRNKDIMSSDQNEKITIQQKTKQIVNEITENFVTWAHNAGLGSDHLDVKWLNDLFQVGMENPAIKSIAVDIEELPILPDSVVAPLNLHDKSERAGLMRQVLWDVMRESGNKGLNKVAFGSYIPWRFKQAKSTRPSARERWLHNYDIPKSMLKGSDLWEKLAKTKSLERYCRWLSTKPDVMRPKYLEHSKCLSVTKKKALKLDDIYSNAIRLEGEFDHDTDSSEDEDFKCLTVWARSMNTRRGRAGVAHIFDIGHPSQYDEERFADMEAEFLSTVPKASSRMKSRRFKMLISEDDDD